MSARERRAHSKRSRVAGRFIALPHDVLESQAYQSLSHPARSLLIEVAMQFNGFNNGKLLLTAKLMKARGWRSADVIGRAKKELLEKGFLHETFKGYRPNRASWYAVTWQNLEVFSDYDPGAKASFERGAYRNNLGAGLTPRKGPIALKMAPPGKAEVAKVALPHGPILGSSLSDSATSAGTHLEIPSDGVVSSLYSSPTQPVPEKLKKQSFVAEQVQDKFPTKSIFGRGRSS